MTPEAFQQRYETYCTADGAQARQEAAQANAEGIDGDRAVAVNFGFAWGLMLESAYHYLRDEVGLDALETSEDHCP